MESSSNIDLENLSVLLARSNKTKDLGIQPTPYTFTKLENGKKTVIDPNSIAPPSWLLLDHTIAVVWLMFSSNSPSHQLNINDLKWAHEFLKEIRNSKGENPPDVKTCLKEIQDRLINLYARLTNMKEKDVDQISFGEKFFEESKSYLMAPKIFDSDRMSLASSLYPSETTIRMEYPLFHRHSTKEMTIPKQKRINYSKTSFPLFSKNSNIFEDSESVEDEELENYVLSLFKEDKKEEISQSRSGKKSFIPTKRRIAPTLSDVMSSRDSFSNLREKPTKRLVAEMRSLKFQKSMKVHDTNGEEAAYSNLKAEIRRLTFNPDTSRTQIKKFLKEWRTEQMDRVHNDLTRLNSIEEIIKSIDEAQPNLKNSSFNLKELETSKSNSSLGKSFLP